MVKFQKFQFDNFIVDEDNNVYAENWENSHINVEELEVDAEQTEVLETPSTEVETQDKAPVQEIEQEEIEPIITYREDEVIERENKAKEQGHEEGYQEGYRLGFQEANQAKENMHNLLMENLDNNFRDFVQAYKQEFENNNFETSVIEVCKAVINKLVPVVVKENSAAIVEDFLSKNFASFKSEAKLSFYTHPNNIALLQEVVSNLARKYDFEGKISLHKDENMSDSDCRVEWENGGVERNYAKMLDKITKIFDANEQKEN